MYIKLTNGTPTRYTIGQLRRDNPNTSFPKRIPDEMLLDWGVYKVKKVDEPEYDHTKNIAEETPVLTDGVWTQVWNVTDASAEEIAERTANEAVSVRAKRDQLLAETDWTVLQDSPLTDAQTADWVIYRQALRDITDHANFPFLEDADWPTKSE